MPIYEYECVECGNTFEEWQSNFEEVEMPCPECGKKSRRLISNTTFVLKGGGWYVTEYGNGGQAPQKNGGSDGTGSETTDTVSETAAAAPAKEAPVSASASQDSAS